MFFIFQRSENPLTSVFLCSEGNSRNYKIELLTSILDRAQHISYAPYKLKLMFQNNGHTCYENVQQICEKIAKFK